jgi:hypothetical protein
MENGRLMTVMSTIASQGKPSENKPPAPDPKPALANDLQSGSGPQNGAEEAKVEEAKVEEEKADAVATR